MLAGVHYLTLTLQDDPQLALQLDAGPQSIRCQVEQLETVDLLAQMQAFPGILVNFPVLFNQPRAHFFKVPLVDLDNLAALSLDLCRILPDRVQSIEILADDLAWLQNVHILVFVRLFLVMFDEPPLHADQPLHQEVVVVNGVALLIEIIVDAGLQQLGVQEDLLHGAVLDVGLQEAGFEEWQQLGYFIWCELHCSFFYIEEIGIKFTLYNLSHPIMQASTTSLIVLDIGGTLSKACFVTDAPESSLPHDPRLTIKLDTHVLLFNYFKNVEQCWQFLRAHFSAQDKFTKIIITGGGAYKYSEQLGQISKLIGKEVVVVQEFESLVGGLSFFEVNHQIPEFIESYVTNEEGKSRCQSRTTSYSEIKDSPIMVVNIGSGVSILNVRKNEQGQLKAERVGGTSLGGGFFMGLANLLVGENNFQKLLEMAQKGNVKYTDLVPEDFPEIGGDLSQASVLVSLGKLNKQSSPNDIVRSLFFMVTFNLAQIALSYSQIKNAKHVLFTGFYLRGNNFFLECFTQAFHFFTKKTEPKYVYSMLHDGYLGTLGALQMQSTRQK